MTDTSYSNGKVKIYGFWASPFVSIVAHFCKQSNIDFEYVKVSPFLGDTLKKDHLQRNPMKKVPVLQDKDGTLIYETLAICRYLAREYPDLTVRVLPSMSDTSSILAVEQVTEIANVLLQGCVYHWIVVGHYLPNPKLLNWSELAHECGACRRFMEIGILATLGRIKDAYFKQDASPLLLGTETPILADIILFQAFVCIEFFDRILAMEGEIPHFYPLQLHPSFQTFFDTMSQTDAAAFILSQQQEEESTTVNDIFTFFRAAYSEKLASAKDMYKAGLSTHSSAYANSDP